MCCAKTTKIEMYISHITAPVTSCRKKKKHAYPFSQIKRLLQKGKHIKYACGRKKKRAPWCCSNHLPNRENREKHASTAADDVV